MLTDTLRKLEFDFCLTGEMEQCSGMLFLRTTFSIIIIKLFFVWSILASLAWYYVTQQLFQHSSTLLLLYKTEIPCLKEVSNLVCNSKLFRFLSCSCLQLTKQKIEPNIDNFQPSDHHLNLPISTVKNSTQNLKKI